MKEYPNILLSNYVWDQREAALLLNLILIAPSLLRMIKV